MKIFLTISIVVLIFLIIGLVVFYKKLVKPSFDFNIHKLTQIRKNIQQAAKDLASK